MEQEKKYYGRISQEELDRLKAKYGDIYEISVPLDDEEKELVVAYFRKPDRTTLGAALSQEERNPMKGKEILLRSTFVAGDKRILEDDDLFISASLVANEMVQIRLAQIKKK